MKTRAVVIPGANQIELREVELAPLGPDDVLVQTHYTSISAGTERMMLAGQLPHPMLSFPVVPGYETVGRVVQAGGALGEPLIGQTVFVGGSRGYVDVTGAWGGQAAHLVVAASRVVPLADLAPTTGVLIALAATALHGIDLVAPQEGTQVLVLGQGPVGQMAARWARKRGVHTTVVDKTAERLEQSVGDEIVDVSARALSNLDLKIDLIVEATGSMTALAGALTTLVPGGTILLLGFYDTLHLPYIPLFMREARLITAKEWAPGDTERARDLLVADPSAARLLTHTLPITEVTQAYQWALHDPACLKLVLDWETT